MGGTPMLRKEAAFLPWHGRPAHAFSPTMTPTDFLAWLADENRRPLVMGVLNVTPDSFSDGGRYSTTDAAVARAGELIQQGADLLDIGGESTRPGSQPVGSDEQIARVEPVIRAIRTTHDIALSIDTQSAQVAEAALDAGASIVNDISAGRADANLLPLVAARQVPLILMHMQGTPATMQVAPVYQDVVAEVLSFLSDRIEAATRAGVDRRLVLIDPGIGFGKSLDHNLSLLRRQRDLLALGRPLVIGTSRKGFIGAITGVKEPADRLFGTAATTAWAVANGAAIVRVHDVEPNVQVVKMIQAVQHGHG
jgi:dihydropteroate synthase